MKVATEAVCAKALGPSVKRRMIRRIAMHSRDDLAQSLAAFHVLGGDALDEGQAVALSRKNVTRQQTRL